MKKTVKKETEKKWKQINKLELTDYLFIVLMILIIAAITKEIFV